MPEIWLLPPRFLAAHIRIERQGTTAIIFLPRMPENTIIAHRQKSDQAL